jgi:hypothetical protein
VINEDAGARETAATFLEPLGFPLLAAEKARDGLLLAATRSPASTSSIP